MTQKNPLKNSKGDNYTVFCGERRRAEPAPYTFSVLQ